MQVQNSRSLKFPTILLVANAIVVLALILVVGAGLVGKTSALRTWMRTAQPRVKAAQQNTAASPGGLAELPGVCVFDVVCVNDGLNH